eukprot:627966-Amphidinium_carterae.1
MQKERDRRQAHPSCTKGQRPSSTVSSQRFPDILEYENFTIPEGVDADIIRVEKELDFEQLQE